jgi:hypothetical protein
MSEPRTSVVRFVRAAAGAELARFAGTLDAQDSDAAQLVMKRLYQELAKLLGPAGFNALLARSLVLARLTHPALAGVSVASEGLLVGLRDSPDERVAQQSGALAVVAHFIELLVVLVGEDLAMVLMRDIWPMAVEEEKT